MTDYLDPARPLDFNRTLEAMYRGLTLKQAVLRTGERMDGWAAELAAVRQINNALPFAEPIALAEDETGS